MSTLRDYFLSFEAADGQEHKEVEHIFLCKLEDFDQLKNAQSSELQEQYELRTKPDVENNGVNGVIRVRAIDKGQDPIQYVLTTKLYGSSTARADEVEQEVTEALFEHFKTMAPVGVTKRRYFFPVEGTELVWTVDVYYDEDGNPEGWCRLELEVDELADELPELPLEFAQIIRQHDPELSEEERALVHRLYETVFMRKCEPNFLPLAT